LSTLSTKCCEDTNFVFGMTKRRGLVWYSLFFLLVSVLPDISMIKKLREVKDDSLKPITNQTTTIRIREATKDRIANLDFVKKDTYDEILARLIEFYEKYGRSK